LDENGHPAFLGPWTLLHTLDWDEGRVSFIDASVERLPRSIEGPTARDILFCIKSDLVVLFWDGESPGTRAVADYYQDQGVATLLAFL
jgi:hypothetical protein